MKHALGLALIKIPTLAACVCSNPLTASAFPPHKTLTSGALVAPAPACLPTAKAPSARLPSTVQKMHKQQKEQQVTQWLQQLQALVRRQACMPFIAAAKQR